MKQKLQNRKGRTLESLLPQKWLLSLLTLMLFCIGTDHAWADNYVFDQNAKATFVEGTSTFTFDSKTIEITNDGSKKSGKVTTEFFLGLKYSAGVTYTVTFPEDEIVKSISFTGHTRYADKGSSYIDYVNGVQRNDGNNEPGSTQFPDETASDDDENVTDPTGTYKVNFYSTRQNTVSFKLKGHESSLVITVETEKVDQKYTVNFSVPDVYGANVPDGTLRAKNVTTGQDLTSGGQVNSGDVVEFTAWDFCDNAAQGAVGAGRLILDGWRINGGNVIKDNIPMSGISWWHADIKYQLTVESDIDFEAVYALNYFLHFKDNLGSTDKTYQYDGGTAYAYVDAEKLASNASGFRGNSTVIATATPASGYAFDHWEGQLKGAGDDPVWENSEWSKDNPFTFTSSGSTFDYAWGNDIFVKPVFKSLGVTIGVADKNTSWTKDNGANALSQEFALEDMHEYTFNFVNHSGGNMDPWNSWVLVGYENEGNWASNYFVVRPDSWVIDASNRGGHSNPTLALMGGALDWETFKRDLDGAEVTVKVSFDKSSSSNSIFVYQIIRNNGRTYTCYYPSTEAKGKDKFYLRLAVDNSQLTNFTYEYKRAFKVNTYVKDNHNDYGSITILNEQGTQILNGSVVGADTKMFITAIPNDGYTFKTWGYVTDNPREMTAGYDPYGNLKPESDNSYNFTAEFVSLAELTKTWSLKTPGDVYYSNGSQWNREDNGTFHSDNSPAEFEGAYKQDGSSMAEFDGLLFNNQIRLAKVNGTEVMIKPNGIIKIPVKKGEIVSIRLWNDGGTRGSSLKNTDGNLVNITTTKNAQMYNIVAAGDGYIEVLPISANATNLRTNYISKTTVRDFSFADGNSVPAQPGCDDYINFPVGEGIMKSIVENASFSWSSSNPAEVQVDANTGRIVVNESFSGSVQITATMNAVMDGSTVVLPAVSKSYTLTTSTNKMSFANEKVTKEVDENGVVLYWQDVKWQDANNIPEGTIKYSVVSSSSKSAVITDGENDGDAMQLTINGVGTTVIKASCGALSATYTLTTFGLSFPETAAIYNFSGSYTQSVPNSAGLTYAIEQKHGAIKDVPLTIDNNGTITGFPGYGENKGGAIVVSATDGDGKSVKYVLTIPYKKYTWDFYNEGKSDDVANAQVLTSNHFTTGDLVNNTNPHAASEVPSEADIPNTGTEFPNKYVIDGFGQVDAIKKLLNWQNNQKGTLADNDPHKYWDYTFKTLTHKDKTYKKPIEYCNEPLFSYKGAINGNNVRVVNETQGLVFNCGANSFGINDNLNGSSVGIREQDRAILLYKGASFTIPFVQKDHYVKLHWYRHSTNAGDMFSVTNAKDLDGTMINPAHKLRFTGSHYESNSEYRGYTILQAATDGPMTITNTALASWIELYTVEITDEYSTELKVEYATVIGGNNDGWGGPCSSYYNNNGMFDMHDNLVSVVRKTGSAGNKAYTNADIAVSSYSSLDDKQHDRAKVDNCAVIPSQPVGENPIIYIGSFPGYTNGWNGWSLDVEAFPVDEDARNLKIGLQKELVTRVGNRISYGVHALTNFEGTGTAHVIVRTKSGGVDGSPRYTLDQQEAYFAVGEYHAQEYPYTWDFTTYNMENESVSAEDLTYATTHASVKESYGGWKSTNDWRKLYTIANNEDQNPLTRGVAATVPYSLPNSNARRYNKFLFADGSQLPINAGHGAFEMRESDGLRVSIGAKMKTYMDRAITLYTDDRGLELNSEEAAITIPEVDEGMYVFVKGTTPKSASNTTASDVTFEANADGDVTYYKATGGDVTLTFDGASATIYKIGVTDQVKAIKYYGYATESRAVDIDYNETRYFSAPMAMYYVTNVNGWDQRHDDFNLSDDLEVKTEASTATIKNGVYIPNGTGIIVKNDAVDYKKEQGNTFNGGKDYIVPLFVPACNVKETTGPEVTTANWLKATTSASQASAEIQPTLEDDSKQYYTLNISYVEVGREDNDIKADQVYTSIPRFYRFVGSGKGDSNTYTLVNKAYLELDKPAGVKAMDFFDINFNFDTPEEAPTSVEAADVIDNNNENGIYYNLRGQAVNGKPTVGGIYIKNGKKYYVK